ncbi:bromodomain-containing protein 8-like isoform X1 [Biomphalaria glabrata]|uniref:Bromodomain-containing protein 8-like isoform X1 n=1 Tax=Biomphalaria glabrata TaxID=6526 RepID=A0A9U8EEP5_BIOGL|nr:bromodomain-containing protein 8-like isoform X1 [Biomphalaria glabrata]KAI8769591.1 bromodomain-containing protein 8-like isoform X1 [Biomphalaria glabrata]KAI8789930.1 bromodomain-containing protein 8 isoform X1 [Biomphalaria glabrata]
MMESDLPNLSTVSTPNYRLKLKKPLDVWSTREKLCLASAVFKIGDQNWVSVSRTIKPYADPNRPPDWFHQKNCLLQYYDMMEQLEQPKRKRGSEKSESEAPSLQIMRKMTIERSEQLKKEILEMQQNFKTLKAEVEAIKAGQWDDKIKDVWTEIQEELKAKETKIKMELKSEDDEEDLKTSDLLNIVVCESTDNKQESLDEISVLQMAEEETSQQSQLSSTASQQSQLSSTASTATSAEVLQSSEITSKLPVASHLLSSLLKSEVKSATELQKLKNEQEQVQSQAQLSTVQEISKSNKSLNEEEIKNDNKVTSETVQPALPKLQTAISVPSVDDKEVEAINSTDLMMPINEEIVSETTDFVQDVLGSSQREETLDLQIKEEPLHTSTEAEDGNKTQDTMETKEEQALNTSLIASLSNINHQVDKEEIEVSTKKSVDEIELQESPSPTSSICSRISETGSRRGRSRGRPRSNKTSQLSVKKSSIEEDKKDDGVGSDVDSEEDDPLNGQLTSINPVALLSESFPNSPASLSICSDTEEEKSLKQWKKSIMLVWRAAATHKYANVFLHPVTDDIAPGYRSVVHRPMDLSTIKKNIETGSLRTTVEFQRDMMLMFTNAIMYNASNHNVYKMAKEMYDDVMLHIEQYVNTQMMIQTTDAKNLRQSRRPDTSDKEEEVKKRRHSVDQTEGGKLKKRKTRLDESLP